VNEFKARNDFKEQVEKLLKDIERAVSPEGVDPYLGSGNQKILEHTTRKFFLDGIMQSLGWSLGSNGNMVEEARIKADTTTFMDYVGVSNNQRAPLLIVEAKAWDKPFVTAKTSGTEREEGNEYLISRAIDHIKNEGSVEGSPVTNAWHDYLLQIYGYVKNLKEQYDHDVKRVVLTSGQWMLIFDSPSESFLHSSPINTSSITILHKSEYISHSSDIFALLARETLVTEAPKILRPSQLPSYINQKNIDNVFHGIHVCYEQSGSSMFDRKPRILIYPAIFIRRTDGLLLTIMKGNDDCILEYKNESLDDHLEEVSKRATELTNLCETELGQKLIFSELSSFSGFLVRPRRGIPPSNRIYYVQDQDDTPDQWMFVTGEITHNLLGRMSIDNCRFHSWSECRREEQEIGTSALSIRSIANPRAFFVDTQTHHCANQIIQDRRKERCHIAALDERICCQTCIYLNSCWSEDELLKLPCGH
jgi:hypothetical protein